jgi:hypothetical protein
LGQRCNAGGNMHSDTAHITPADFDLASVKARPDLNVK